MHCYFTQRGATLSAAMRQPLPGRTLTEGTTPMVGFKCIVVLAVLTCVGISSTPSQAQKGPDLFLRCNVKTLCQWTSGPDRGRSCGRATQVRNFRVNFSQRTITDDATSQTVPIRSLTRSEILADSGRERLEVNRITGELNGYLNLQDQSIWDWIDGQCEKADPRPKF
jgi:hypothetical protein